MRDLTGLPDIDNIIYDYVYGSRNPDRISTYDHLVNDFIEVMDEYYEDVAMQGDKYGSLNDGIHKYLINIAFYEIFEKLPSSSPYIYGYRKKGAILYTFDDNLDIILLDQSEKDKNEIIYLYEK